MKIAYSLQSPIFGIELSKDAINACLKAVEFLERQGHELTEVDFPIEARPLIQSYYRMNAAETVAMLEPWERAAGRKLTSQDVELLTYALLEAGRKAPVSSYINALAQWDLAARDFTDKIYKDYDLFLTATTAKTAPKIGQELMTAEVLKEMSEISQYEFEQQIEIIEAAFERSLAFTPYNFISNLTGQPALSLPVYVNEETNLPLGIQLWGPKNSEIELLKVAKEFEEAGQFILPKAYQ